MNGRCPVCKHPWDDHPANGEGCQAQVQINGGWYDCNCPERGPNE